MGGDKLITVEYTIVPVNASNTHLITEFLKNAGSSLIKFRYFNSRPVEIIKNHLITLIIMKGKEPVGYGHLDKEGEKIWLGTAVAEAEKGKGVGRMIMNQLMEEGKKNKAGKITLAVDNDNEAAISLYKNFGFDLQKKESTFSYYEAEVK